jgi:hypothetical protein
LRTTIEAKQQNARKILDLIGHDKRSRREIIRELKNILEPGLDNFQYEMSKLFPDFQSKIDQEIKRVDQKYCDQFYKDNIYVPIFFYGEKPFNECLKSIADRFRPHLYDLVEKMTALMHKNTVHPRLSKEFFCGDLIVNLNKSLRNHIAKFETVQKNEMEINIKDQSKWNTVNHYVESNYQQEFEFPRQLFIQALKTGVNNGCIKKMKTQNIQPAPVSQEQQTRVANPRQESPFGIQPERVGNLFGKPSYQNQPSVTANVQKQSQPPQVSSKENLQIDYEGMADTFELLVSGHMKAYLSKSLQDQQKKKIFCAVKAYLKDVKKKFEDRIAALTRRHGLESLQEWFDEFEWEDAIIESAQDSELTSETRKKNKEIDEQMENCKKILFEALAE